MMFILCYISFVPLSCSPYGHCVLNFYCGFFCVFYYIKPHSPAISVRVHTLFYNFKNYLEFSHQACFCLNFILFLQGVFPNIRIFSMGIFLFIVMFELCLMKHPSQLKCQKNTRRTPLTYHYGDSCH